jgi:hypothetical protein
MAVGGQLGATDRLRGTKGTLEVVGDELQFDRCLPGAVTAVPVRDPDAVPARPLRREVETELVGREGGILVEACTIDHGSEIHRLGPLGVGEGHGLEPRGRLADWLG